MSLSRTVLPIAMASCVLFAGPVLAQEQPSAPEVDLESGENGGNVQNTDDGAPANAAEAPEPGQSSFFALAEQRRAARAEELALEQEETARLQELAEQEIAETAQARAETARLQELAERARAETARARAETARLQELAEQERAETAALARIAEGLGIRNSDD